MSHCKDFHESKCEDKCFSGTRIAVCGPTSEDWAPGKFKGFECLRKKNFNKELAFTLEERQFLGIHGLLPAVIKTEQEQIEQCTLLIERLRRRLDKFMYLQNLSTRNQRLFFKLIESNREKFLPLFCSPVLDNVCLKFSLIFQEPHGLFINAKDKCFIEQVLGNWPERDVRLIVVTDGESVLHLGDQGANAMCLPLNQTLLYTSLVGVKPQHCLPITLDCGSNNKNLIIDPLYIGLRQERLCRQFYALFFEEFLSAVKRRFGPKCLVHCEGFGEQNALRFLKLHAEEHCIFNSDIQCVGSLVLAGIFSALRITGRPLHEQVILIHGAGAASIGIALLFNYATTRLCSKERPIKYQVWLYNDGGLVAADPSKTEATTNLESPFTVKLEPVENLLEAIDMVRPSILVGTSAVTGAFSRKVLKAMAAINERPIVFVLTGNPAKVECTALEAYNHTKAACVYASGVRFPVVVYNKLKLHSSQMHSSAISTGVALGVISAGMYKVPLEVFYIAAETLSDLVSSEDLDAGLLYPPNSKVLCSSLQIAKWIMEFGYRFNVATVYPEPVDKIEFMKSQMYNLNYPNFVPETYAVDFY